MKVTEPKINLYTLYYCAFLRFSFTLHSTEHKQYNIPIIALVKLDLKQVLKHILSALKPYNTSTSMQR